MLISSPPFFGKETEFYSAKTLTHESDGEKKLKKSKSTSKIAMIPLGTITQPHFQTKSLKTKEISLVELKHYFYDDDSDSNESITDESIQLELDDDYEELASPDVENFAQKFLNLQRNYKKAKNSLNGKIALVKQFLSFFEYCSDNKINLENLSKVTLPEYAYTCKNILNTGNYVYKWLESIIPFLAYSIKYQTINKTQFESEEIERSCNKIIDEQQKQKKVETSVQDNVSQIKKNLVQYQAKLKKEKEDARESSKSPRLLTKLLCELLIALKMLRKTAEKICKCFYELYKNCRGFLECTRANEIQKEWLFHLQTQQIVSLKKENPTAIEKENDYFQEVIQKKLREKTKLFFYSLNKSQSIKEVQDLLKEINLAIEIPSSIEQFKQLLEIPRFNRELFQHYYFHMGQRITLNPLDPVDSKRIKLIKEKKQEEYDHKVIRCLPIITKKIDEYHDLKNKIHFSKNHIDDQNKRHLEYIKLFKTIKKNFHIDISSPNSPQNILEWEECLKNEKFITALAQQWVHFQETTAQMSLQAVRQILLSKIKIEQKFLSFQKIQHIFGLVSSMIQLSVCIVGLLSSMIQLSVCYESLKLKGIGQTIELLKGIGQAIELLVTDLTKLDNPSLGLYYITYPLYPGIKCKIDSFASLLAKHFLAIKYKPNEYSLESYKIYVQIQMTNLIIIANSLQFLLQQGLLWINVRLVDNCIQKMNIQPLVEDPSYIELIKKYEQYSLNFRQILQHLKVNLEQLKIKDTKLIIHPHLHDKNYDPIKNLADSIQEADIDYFPLYVLESFENLVGFSLTNTNKGKLQVHLEGFLAKNNQNLKNEPNFWDSYHANRFNYLKV